MTSEEPAALAGFAYGITSCEAPQTLEKIGRQLPEIFSLIPSVIPAVACLTESAALSLVRS
jgi:hypothetical protein